MLDAYWPDVTLELASYAEFDEAGLTESDDYEAFPHVSHVLTTVTGKQMVRARRRDSVDAIPEQALEYQLLFHRHPGGDHLPVVNGEGSKIPQAAGLRPATTGLPEPHRSVGIFAGLRSDLFLWGYPPR